MVFPGSARNVTAGLRVPRPAHEHVAVAQNMALVVGRWFNPRELVFAQPSHYIHVLHLYKSALAFRHGFNPVKGSTAGTM